MKRTVLTLLAFASVSVVTSAASAQQNEWVAQVRRQLTSAGSSFSERGYTLSHDVHTGSLRDDASEDLTLTLDAGTEYQIVGVCDNDCSDVDLTLYNAAGAVVDSDMLDDDVPIVSVTPARSGRYRVHVSMAVCTTEPCYYGVGVYSK
jgi:hypothetical protein